MVPVSEQSTRRPPQVTFAAGLVIVASVFVVLQNFSSASNLRSLENRDRLEAVLAEPPFAGSGATLEQGYDALFATLMVGALCAAAMAVLGGYAMRGSKSARLGLSILAVPLFVTGPLTGVFATTMAAVSAVMLWMSPGREWFRDGKWTPPVPLTRDPKDSADPSVRPPGPSAPRTAEKDASAPRPHVGEGPGAAGQPGPYGHTFGQPYEPHVPGAAKGATPGNKPGSTPLPLRSSRPAAVVAAGLITIFTSAAIAFFMGATMVVVATDFDWVLSEMTSANPELMEQPGVTEDLLRNSVFLMGAGIIAWCAGAVVLGILVLLGRDWARVLLLVSAAVTAMSCLLMAIAGPFTLLPGLAAVFVLFLLRRPDVRNWMSGGDAA